MRADRTFDMHAGDLAARALDAADLRRAGPRGRAQGDAAAVGAPDEQPERFAARSKFDGEVVDFLRDDRSSGRELAANANEIGRQRRVAARLHALVSHRNRPWGHG
jgi:hypothetical protein